MVGTRHGCVLILGNINSDATGFDMTESQKFYIVKRSAGNCEILPLAEPSQRIAQIEPENPAIIEKWGPYDSAEDAIARRIGLIRAGKCQPQ